MVTEAADTEKVKENINCGRTCIFRDLDISLLEQDPVRTAAAAAQQDLLKKWIYYSCDR
jgi:hypothetical protein